MRVVKRREPGVVWNTQDSSNSSQTKTNFLLCAFLFFQTSESEQTPEYGNYLQKAKRDSTASKISQYLSGMDKFFAFFSCKTLIVKVVENGGYESVISRS